MTEECTKVAALLYEKILEAPVRQVSDPTVAEMEKILENTYRYINIGLINEFAMLCERINVNLWEVIEAAKTKPYGFHTSMIESAMIINDNMPNYCVERAMKIFNERGKAMKNSNILILGIAYKNEYTALGDVENALQCYLKLYQSLPRISYTPSILSRAWKSDDC